MSENPNQPRTFTYGYMGFRCKATLDGSRLTVKQGWRKVVVRVPDLTLLFVRLTDTHQTLFLSERRRRGKKVHRLVANPGDPGFLVLIDGILALRPDVDARGLETKTAFEKMGVAKFNLALLVLPVVIVPCLVATLLAPKLVHGLDFGEERVSIANLAKGKRPSSRNVVITGARAQLGESIEVNKRRIRGSVQASGNTRFLVPLVHPYWDKSQAIHVILETDSMNSAEEAKLEQAIRFRGILRNVLWEGLSRADRDYLASEARLVLSDDVKLVEYRANPRYDLMVFLCATGASFLLMLAITFGLWFKTRQP